MILVNAGISSAGWIWSAQMVARSASRLVKLRTGVLSSSVVRLRAAFARASLERWGRPDRVGAFGGGRFVLVDKQGLWPGLFHVPADVVGQHAQ